MGRFLQNTVERPVAYEPRPFPNAHGTYDAQGKWHQQVVYYSTTMSGKPGLFTGSMLCWGFDEELNSRWLAMNRNEREAYCRERGFVLGKQ
jgi:hypothetical protein